MGIVVVFCDFPTLCAVANLNPAMRHLARLEMRRRVLRSLLLDYLAANDIESFFDMLYDCGGCFFGHVAQEICVPGSGAGLKPRARWAVYCNTHEELNIQVPGPSGLRSCIRWLAKRGYIYWRGRMHVNGRLTDSSDYVVGYSESSFSTVCAIFVYPKHVDSYQILLGEGGDDLTWSIRRIFEFPCESSCRQGRNRFAFKSIWHEGACSQRKFQLIVDTNDRTYVIVVPGRSHPLYPHHHMLLCGATQDCEALSYPRMCRIFLSTFQEPRLVAWTVAAEFQRV